MNETTNDILAAVRICVNSGFYDIDDVHQVVDDLLEGDADEALLRAAVQPEFDKKAAAELTWPAETDCDRLDHAFDSLNSDGIIALQNAGYTMSDGLDDVSEAIHQQGTEGVIGYCFYHGQDLERAVGGGGIMLAFGDLHDDDEGKRRIARAIRATLEEHGLAVDWNGELNTRLSVPTFDWKRRGPA